VESIASIDTGRYGRLYCSCFVAVSEIATSWLGVTSVNFNTKEAERPIAGNPTFPIDRDSAAHPRVATFFSYNAAGSSGW
jgi:hypothetical protein